MNHRFLVLSGALAALLTVGMLTRTQTAGQQAPAPATNSTNWTQPRTVWGDPDLQGVYTFSTNTPFQRPLTLADKNLTASELAELDEQRTAQLEADVVDAPEGSLGPSYNFFWESNEKGRLAGRIALVVDPENGRIPPLTPEGEKKREALAAELASRTVGKRPFTHVLINTWRDHPTYTRCISRPMPRIAQEYNHGLQILQMPGYVAIHYESMHDVRIIPLDGRPHLDQSVRQWNGDSRGRWEGNTLVVDWTNFADQPANGSTPFGGFSQSTMHYTERFTKVDAHTIDYKVTIDDPTTWTRPWTFALPWRSDDPNYQNPEDLYEFACHEGNYRMMEDTLNGTRALKQGLSGN